MLFQLLSLYYDMFVILSFLQLMEGLPPIYTIIPAEREAGPCGLVARNSCRLAGTAKISRLVEFQLSVSFLF